MGIDVYLRWDNMSEAEKQAQYTGFSVESGHVGYLREAYHGEPYATRILVPESFSDKAPEDGAEIPACVMHDRLPDVIKAAMEREEKVYKASCAPDDPVVQSYVNFVRLAETKERETGKACRVIASY